MATNNFYVFDENTNNIMTLSDYSASTTRTNGVVSGIADSMLHNRLYRQSSIMVAALGQVIADSGTDANDGDLAALVSALKSTLVIKSGSTVSVSDGGTGQSSFTSNALITGNGSNGLKSVTTKKGAAYATSTNGAVTFGTLPVAEGGTGLATITSNAILTGNGTGNVVAKATSSGAAYATSSNGALTFGTLPVAQGGTGQTTLAALRNSMGLGNTTGVLPVANGGTGNSSVDTTPTASSTKMVTSGGIKTALDSKADLASPVFTGSPTIRVGSNNQYVATNNYVLEKLNRNNSVNSSNTSYSTAMARAIYAGTTDMVAGSTALVNGTIYLVYEEN